jgi:hypothetical protein
VSVQSEAPGHDSSGSTAGSSPADRPEVAIGIAFVGGFLLAKVVKRLGK